MADAAVDRCPECGGAGRRGCGAAWHDGRPDTEPSPADDDRPGNPFYCVVPEDEITGYVVVVLRPTGDPTVPAADAYGPHGEREAHDIATLAIRSQRVAFMVNVADLTVERYRPEDLFT